MEISVRDIIAGNHFSFERLFGLTHKKVYAYYLKKTQSCDLADELTQLTFIKLWKFRHTLSEVHSLDTQLFRIAKTVLLDHFKHIATEERKLATFKQTAPSYSNPASSYEINQEIHQILKQLPPTRQRIFILSRIEGYSYQEIAEKLNISPRTVEKHISLAIKQLAVHTYLALLLITNLI